MRIEEKIAIFHVHTGWGNRIFTPSTTQLGSGGGENPIAPPCTVLLSSAEILMRIY